jgi:hypothetical protein
MKTYKFIIPGVVRVWHTEGEISESFIISEKDNKTLTLEQLKELFELKAAGDLEELNPLTDSSL